MIIRNDTGGLASLPSVNVGSTADGVSVDLVAEVAATGIPLNYAADLQRSNALYIAIKDGDWTVLEAGVALSSSDGLSRLESSSSLPQVDETVTRSTITLTGGDDLFHTFAVAEDSTCKVKISVILEVPQSTKRVIAFDLLFCAYRIGIAAPRFTSDFVWPIYDYNGRRPRVTVSVNGNSLEFKIKTSSVPGVTNVTVDQRGLFV